MDEEKRDSYIKSCYEYNTRRFEALLNGSFLNTDPYDLSNKELYNYLVKRTEDYNKYDHYFFNTFCNLYVNKGVEEREWNRTYNVVVFEPYNKKPYDENLIINCSQFMYGLSPYYTKDSGSFGYEYDSNKAGLVSLVDDNEVNPYSYFGDKVGTTFLLACHFPGVNAFGKLSSYNRLYSINDVTCMGDDIRKIIVKSQYSALHFLLKNPSYYFVLLNDIKSFQLQVDENTIYNEVFNTMKEDLQKKMEEIAQRIKQP